MTKLQNIIIVLIIGLTVAIAVMAWTNPSGNPTIGGGTIGVGTNAPANSLYIKSDGNVGIGTAAPSTKLEVNGNIKANGTICDVAGGCVRKTYVSPWQLIHRSVAGSPQNVTFNHPLGTDQIIVAIQIRYNGVIHQQHNSDYGGWGQGVEAYEITPT